MIKRFYLLGAALLLSLAVATPSHAGSACVSTASFDLAPSTVHELDITYFGAGTISDLVVTGSPFTSASVVGGDIVEIKFATTSSATFSMTFDSDQDQGLVLGGGYHGAFTYTASHTGGKPSSSITLNASSVPEPASMAMLGIGMAGLVAFRRIRNKRNDSA
jgi:hypothetical protein